VDLRIDPRAEWPQIFDEAWRITRDYFYATNYHGVDWDAQRKKYAEFIPHAATRGDVARVIRWMLSELRVGHSYQSQGQRLGQPPRVGVGLLGADYDVVRDKLTVGVDAFDFTRKGDQPPHLKAFGNYDIVKNLFITGGVDDVLNNDKKLRTFFFGLGIKFADEDLKTVLGAVPLKP
jgi:hypothetical protein